MSSAGLIISLSSSTLAKLAAGNTMVGLSFLFLAAAGAEVNGESGDDVDMGGYMGASTLVSFWWIFLHIFVLTVGELHVQPVGLSFISRYAPPGSTSLMMGVWYTSTFAGRYVIGYSLATMHLLRHSFHTCPSSVPSFLGGVVGRLYSVLSIGGFYLLVAVAATVNGLIMIGVVRPLERWVHAGNRGTTTHEPASVHEVGHSNGLSMHTATSGHQSGGRSAKMNEVEIAEKSALLPS
eukprot:SAG31_NODE_10318_length_1154_cov_1.424645_1_plen_237_part_00